MKLFLIALACFLFGMTWDLEFRRAYYECRGFFSLEQTLLGVEFVVSWADTGFNYPTEWDIRRTERHSWPTGGHYRYNPLATTLNTKSTEEARHQFEREAIAAGHAKFVVKDKLSGKTEFCWNLGECTED